MSDHAKETRTQQGENQMGLFGGTGPVLGGSAGGQNYSLASMLDRANAKKSGDSSAAGAKDKKDLGDPLMSTGTKDLLEGSGLLPGAKGGWEPRTPIPKQSAPAAHGGEGAHQSRPEVPDLHPAMSEGARNLLEGSGLLPERKK
ncbi:hypothetical protein COCSUDRAFT_67342 [Coccomyxa subellipsoidea C-169]|uniref:Uncharacterized protein n=1 Tax=Coccomyxa subellipsoidea (strain C-169) TaxID=574566 RepID=I0YPS2_COCSC|nr:hypothetical protein COCSUDRAFT_67342 [Coccomyxa subellipsoidea C-169]EIE20391.1 hypothetical protein COCSUDRAFT_67342 [Coccomyxa subellipsoidea C-169]|eukprot:XP_005644935.1 hypothetical protein COCSUDRAFT_67342 [Coccomyxa subellipsoidea C-169]